ncbi:uncharacterized protein LOC142168056 [Nicotiana tabacum]|uniref:Uncharacterized protein LOC142168056 n=1 Tax=Nicotiana tabacum TaxID=4097 RepID=A0AC58SIK8_TOBAC
MGKFGFFKNWIDLIWGILQGIWYSIIINGARTDFFTSTQGLKQGDPLSSSLFIIGAKVLSRSLNELNDFISFTPFSMDHRVPIINHLAYADDIVIFCGPNNMTIKLIKKVIDKYKKASLQKVNNGKREILAISLMVCSPKLSKELNGWQANMLSSMGRIILIKHVLQSLPTYILSAMNPPKGIIKLVEKHFANFFWGTNDGKNKYHWSSWNNLCLPKDEGGTGVRKMEDIIYTLSIKRWWRFRTQPSLWANFLKSKYCKRAHPVNKRLNPNNSHI